MSTPLLTSAVETLSNLWSRPQHHIQAKLLDLKVFGSECMSFNLLASQLKTHRTPKRLSSMRARGNSLRGGTSHGGSRGGGASRARGQSYGNNIDKRTPARIIHVPEELWRPTKDTERTRIVATWKNETGCEVIPQPQPEHGSGRSVITKFELFGTTEKLDKATQKIEEWIDYSVSKTSETTGWANISAHNPKEWYQKHIETEQGYRKKKFLGDMPENEATTYKSLVNGPI